MNKIFIGSSSKSKSIAEAVQIKLESLLSNFKIDIWSQNVFIVSRTFIESLLEASREEYDYAVFVFAPDDISSIEGEQFFNVRANVIFEYGLFTGTLNRERVFVLSPSDIENFIIPSDILGVTVAQYSYNQIKNGEDLDDVIHKPCLEIKHAISKVRPNFSNTIIGSYTTPREHYKIANGLLSGNEIMEIILVQKSSSLILGHEAGDYDERKFIENLISHISAGKRFYHITNRFKIRERLNSKKSYIKNSKKEVIDLFIERKVSSIRVPKFDSPQPILLIKYVDTKKPVEGIILSHTGLSETCLHIRGKMMKAYWDTYLECYHNRCKELETNEISKLLKHE